MSRLLRAALLAGHRRLRCSRCRRLRRSSLDSSALRSSQAIAPTWSATMQRMHSVTTLERICADAWPPIVSQPLGQWRLRAAHGYTGRANSALALGDPGNPVTTALQQVHDFCHQHSIAPKVQAVHGSDIEPDLAAAGWSPDPTHAAGALVSVQVGPLNHGT